MKYEIEKLIKIALKELDIKDNFFIVEHPDIHTNGDYSTNVAMVCAKKLGKNPKELALSIKEILEKKLPIYIKKIEIAGPGFINFYLSRIFYSENINFILKNKEDWGKNKILLNKKVIVEYTDPNPFKPFHIGHLMANAIGESISRIVEFSGAETIRANYQGDVGPHVAKAIYGIQKFGKPNEDDSISKQAFYIGECYSKGSNLYDTDELAKKDIDNINKKIYKKDDEEINKIYNYGRKITLLAFEEIYKILGTKFDYYFFESEMAPVGEKIVRENIGNIFQESDGAVVFHAEEFDKKLHTRVFINSQGIPTYEAKEIGLALTKQKNINPDLSIVTTAIEQGEYMKVVQKALSIMHPEMEKKMKHITHGMMKLTTGKMSSRKGNIITGESLLIDSMNLVLNKMENRDFSDDEKSEISKLVGVAALKYSILRSSLGSDIIYDSEKSISFEGDSGPYLQYTAVRANSIINKSLNFDFTNKYEIPEDVSDIERILYIFPEIVIKSYEKLEPHHISTYLTEITSTFNGFYGNTQILKDDNIYADYHIKIVKAYFETMKNGLYLLGIKIPEKM